MSRKPRIAVLMDENTKDGATRYEVSKAYFAAVHGAGGLAFGIPYFADMIDTVADEFDGMLGVGGRIQFPDGWYGEGGPSQFPQSDRFAMEQALMRGFLARDKAVLGICNGMQMLSCLNDARMIHEVRTKGDHILNHDGPTESHAISVAPGTMLSRIVGASTMTVNSRHKEAVIAVPASVVASAHAEDGVIEAVEIPSRRFALGIQWHQEAFSRESHPGNRIFDAFIEAARSGA